MGSATVDRCGGCGGLWFDRGEVERVMRLDVSGTRPDARSMSAWPKWRATERDVRYVPCVRCGERMARRAIAPRAGPVVDLCRAHGIWFDGGEFEHFRAFADAGGLDMATEEEARKADLEREREKEVDALQRFDAERRPGRSHGLLATDASDRVFGPASVWSVLRSLRRGIRR
jgi:Zn-finger nucleic acid-binding protein